MKIVAVDVARYGNERSVLTFIDTKENPADRKRLQTVAVGLHLARMVDSDAEEFGADLVVVEATGHGVVLADWLRSLKRRRFQVVESRDRGPARVGLARVVDPGAAIPGLEENAWPTDTA